MAQAKLKYEEHTAENLFEDTRYSVDLKDRQTSELVIGLCGPIGSPINDVSKSLMSLLGSVYRYDCQELKLSQYIGELVEDEVPAKPEHERIGRLIKYGNFARDTYSQSILAELAIRDISVDREQFEKKEGGSEFFKTRRKVFVINSIKNQAEYELLKQVYGQMFYFFGVYSPVEVRKTYLKSKDMSEEQIARLIDMDSGEERDKGQTVRQTFQLADFFIRIETESKDEIEKKLGRYLSIIFKTKVATPTPEETAMYSAYSAAANSACLSRQVGACLMSKSGKILSVGWNDVPKAGGGLYTTKEDTDLRCFNKRGGKCFNDEEKRLIVDLIIRGLESQKASSPQLLKKIEEILFESRVNDLIEFSRAIHAEMHAILSAAKTCGQDVENSVLFCTTYPCHSCARHIILAGIKEVYYIEPYRKSLAIKLHDDAISEKEADVNKVRVLLYDGVSPKRYLELFKMYEMPRKEDKTGSLVSTPSEKAVPKSRPMIDSFPFLESFVISNLVTKKVIDLKEGDSAKGKPTSDETRPAG